MAMSGRFTLPLLLASTLAACGGHDEAHAPAAIQGLKTLEVTAADGAEGRAWDGVVEAVRQATLTAQTSGRVAAVNYDVNDRVKAGAVLLRLSVVEQQAGVDSAVAQLRSAEASLAEAESNYKRYQALAGSQYVSKSQLDQMRAGRDSALAARNAAAAGLAQARQSLGYTQVRAPFDGVVSSRNVEPGESVVFGGDLIGGQTLMTVFAPDELRIEVSVPQSEAERVRARPEARVSFDDGRRVAAAGVVVFPSADPATHAVKVRINLPVLDPAPQPGGTAKVAFPAVTGAAYPRVPVSALVRRGEINAVYVLADGRLSLRQLRLGEQSGDTVEVISGLKPGEKIAVDPVAAVQALVAARKGGD
ncbi:efflux transporter periplasmic adaptor subunit [Pseudoxanthomonas kalamensis DSM 18571]|nr:efflux transporter periplasmic adaptor subunit [Pseudoxanthomonas kalamensis DSM 18571]